MFPKRKHSNRWFICRQLYNHTPPWVTLFTNTVLILQLYTRHTVDIIYTTSSFHPFFSYETLVSFKPCCNTKSCSCHSLWWMQWTCSFSKGCSRAQTFHRLPSPWWQLKPKTSLQSHRFEYPLDSAVAEMCCSLTWKQTSEHYLYIPGSDIGKHQNTLVCIPWSIIIQAI